MGEVRSCPVPDVRELADILHQQLAGHVKIGIIGVDDDIAKQKLFKPCGP